MNYRLRIWLYSTVLVVVLAFISCAGLPPVPLIPHFNENQRQAAYISESGCIDCHSLENKHWSHTVHARIFKIDSSNELYAKSCEACHGPGSKHRDDPFDKSAIISFTRESMATIRQQNSMCLQCHQGGERLYWAGSAHQINDLGCSDCHNTMMQLSQGGLLRDGSINKTCFFCHQQQRAQFSKRSHMPLPEGKMNCADCHNPHGSSTEPLLQAISINQLCYSCHAEKRGPFIWEHAPVRENCLNCHQAHGSNHEFLLITTRPFLCQYCHSNRGHPNELLTTGNLPTGLFPDARLVNRSCQNCHVQIHGSNHPSGVRFHR